MNEYDAVVVGAGTGGCLAAKTLADSGLNVCLVERKKSEEIGEKVCGDALGEHHIKFVGLENPNGGELETRIEGIRIYSPDMETVFTIAHEDFKGFLLNRRLFGQWLLKKATDAGAHLEDSAIFLEPIIEKGFVSGIKYKKKGKERELKSKVVVDASGFLGIVRHKLPPEMGLDCEIENEDVEACYREIRLLKQETENTKYCEIYLNQEATPGGYVWIFPKGGAKVNVGLGICMRGKWPNPKVQYEKYVLSRPIFEGSTLLNAGAWWDPTRRPLDSMVGNGVVLVGDAASLVNPIHGGGIGPSMLSGYLAGQTIAKALEKGEPSREALWSYNKDFMSNYGKKQASLDAFRMFLISCTDEDINYGMANRLLTEDDVLKAGMGDEFHLNITETTKRVFKGLRRLSFLNKLRLTVTIMRKIGSHYSTYPETPAGYEQWRSKTVSLVEEAKNKII